MKEKLQELLKDFKSHISVGMNWVLPILVIGGLAMAIGMAVPEGPLKELIELIADVGLKKYDIFVVMFIANSVVNRISLTPGFIVGFVSNSLGLGIFGAIAAGLLVGYLTKYLMSAKIKGSLKALYALIAVPLISTILAGLIVRFILYVPIFSFSNWLTTLLEGMYGKNAILLAAILGLMIGFDLGGPVNKVAGLFALTMKAEGVHWPMTMAATAYMVPSLGVGLATILDRKKALFDEEQNIMGKTSFMMGFFLLSEPAIPFMLEDPKFMIPANMIASSLLCVLYAVFGISATVSLGPIFSFPFTNKPIIGLLILVGVVIALSLSILMRRTKINKA